MVFSEYLNSVYSVANGTASFIQTNVMKMGHKALSTMGVINNSTPEIKLPPNLKNLDVSKLVHHGNIVVRVAALSGAAAVILGAYGAHTLSEKENFEERVALYETANRYHFFHTFALMGAPLCRYPRVVASFMVMGMVLFCGTCYYHAFTGNKNLKNLTPAGGVFLILGWLSMVL